MENIKQELLKDYEKEAVQMYVSYLKQLNEEKDKDGKQKNYWFTKLTEQNYIDVFRNVFKKTKMYIDGDTITLNFRGKLMVTYDYHAYMNRILKAYPDTKFDFQVVYEGDEFKFRKESGRVIYSHTISNPFANKKVIVGAYGVIKNTKGEFIELINTETITKMRNTSTMKSIWQNWEDRMVLKSVIKRICSAHFHDITVEISEMDNETNEVERVTLNEVIQNDIDNAETLPELTKIYNDNVKNVEDVNAFILLCGNKRKEIESNKI